MLLQAVQLCATAGDMVAILNIAFGYVWLIILMWVSWISSRMLRRRGFEIETLAFFLTSLGWAVIASAVPSAMFKQGIALLLGLICFGVLGFLLRDMQRIKALRWPMAGLALLLLLYVLFFGESIFGARNWISIGSFSLQPSELVKICFIFARAATLDRLFARRNLYSFIALSMAIVGLLALMSDFGTAAIFFVVFLIIAYLRSGDVATIALAIAAAALAIILVVSFKPYIGARFATWGHAWEYMYSSGYQQASAMSTLASGGLFGMGGGQGWLHYIAAADTDLVFALVAEEWGFIIALSALLAVMAMAGFAVKESTNARSSYYVIAACGTAGLFVFQLMLNVGGSLDLLPLTGVTFPFVSNGGSSLIACWGLLAFLKAADTRRNASFATPVMRRRRRKLAANIVTDIEVDDVIAWEEDADE